MVGQSGTASPTFLLVTIPPLQISKSVATHVSHAKWFSHLVEVAEDIRDQANRGLRGFRGSIFCSRRPVGDVRASHSEAATAVDWANCQVEADSVATAAALLLVDAAARVGLAV